MAQHPTQGVPGSKPRLPKSEGNGHPRNKAEMQRLSKEYLTHRNRHMEAKAYLAEMAAQRRRGELLDKKQIGTEIADVFVAFRAEVLSFPSRYAAQMVGLRGEHEAKQILTTAAHEFLTALSELRPEKIFQRAGQDEDEKPLRPTGARQLAAEEARVQRRRAKKAATMRRLRAKED
jgi:hypothetical protein